MHCLAQRFSLVRTIFDRSAFLRGKLTPDTVCVCACKEIHTHTHTHTHILQPPVKIDTPRSREDETRNEQQNANRNPETNGDFSQLVKIEKLKFLGISRYKFELRF